MSGKRDDVRKACEDAERQFKSGIEELELRAKAHPEKYPNKVMREMRATHRALERMQRRAAKLRGFGEEIDIEHP